MEVATEVKLKSEGAAYNVAKRYRDPADLARWPLSLRKSRFR